MTTNRPSANLADEPTIGRLVADTTRDVSELVRSEIELAKTELRFSVKAGGTGVALFALAAFMGLLAIVMISIAFGFALDTIPGINPAVAFLIVFGVYVLIAALLAFIGYRKVKQVKAPEQTIEAVKSTREVFKRS
jgi:F0F1-type ATP synthase assembly protein I